jgi:hypothetical protein
VDVSRFPQLEEALCQLDSAQAPLRVSLGWPENSWLFHRLAKLRDQIWMEPLFQLEVARFPRLAAVLDRMWLPGRAPEL